MFALIFKRLNIVRNKLYSTACNGALLLNSTERRNLMIKSLAIVSTFLSIFILCFTDSEAYDIGVYYFPGWSSSSKYWDDIKGLPGSRSPNIPWPDREPLLGYYPEEEQWVTDKHLEWAYQYGITFFAYDWYWDGEAPLLDHAVNNYLKSPLKDKVKFSILWANHSEVPRNRKEFEDMIDFWITYYFQQPSFYRIDGKPVVFVFSPSQLDMNAKKFGMSGKELLQRASKYCIDKIGKEIYFVAITNAKPSDNLQLNLKNFGYSAYTGWNYVTSEDKSKIADYNSMIKTYKDFYQAAASAGKYLKYIVPASPGWDNRPWKGQEAIVRTDSTPEKFKEMLIAAKDFLDKEAEPKIIMIEAWNEFGEGSYIEPTKKWGFKYLETIKEVFGK